MSSVEGSRVTRSPISRSAITRSEITRSGQQTQALGAQLALSLQPGDVLALQGDLGAGKTCLIQGICHGLYVEDVVNSPTFILVNEYSGRIATTKIVVYHFDLYRLDDAAQLVDLGLEDYLGAGGISLFEWAERGADLLPQPRWDIELEQTADDERRISWAYGP